MRPRLVRLARNLLKPGSMTTSLIGSRSNVGRRREAVVRIARLLDYVFGLLYTLLGIRLVLELIGARKGTGFVGFVDSLTGPFYAPFKGIVPSDTLDGSHPVVWSLVIAIVAYMLLHGAIRGLLHLFARE
jgi:hypothetical protein